MRHKMILAAGTALLGVAPALAQDASGRRHADYHGAGDDRIIVTAPFARARGDVLSGTSVVSGETLTRELRPTIGETLARQPGVSSTSFGPNVARPVLRGFQGERVRILTDGIGSFDVSNTSVDHAVAINPLTADRIEVLRGPAALLFGSSAIGGVVNVVDSRIPRRIPDGHMHVDAIGTLGAAADERSASAAVQAPIGNRFVVHVDGSYSKTGDLDTGSYILSPTLRAEAAGSDEAEIAELAALRGTLPNSAGRSWEVAGGAALVTETGHLGFSISRLDNRYGIPNRYETAHEEGETHAGEGHHQGDIRLHLKQTRFDMRGEVETGGGLLDTVRLRAGYADYRHDEIEPSGEIGTSFFNDSYEARLELVQAERDGWKGAVGAQGFIRNFDVVGEEAFLPKNETQQYGVFTLQEFDFGALKAEVGARYEHSRLRAFADAERGNADIRRSFDSLSASVGASAAVAGGWRAGVNLSRTVRAPAAEELFANGPHAGTQSFEVGDPTLKSEKSLGVEAVLRGAGDGYSFEASAYHSWFDDYIYQVATGGEQEALPVYVYRQAEARYYGFEVQGSLRLARLGGWEIVGDALADYVRARITSEGSAPRIPPLRVLGGLEAQSERLQGRVEVEWVDDQRRIAAFETSTKGYNMVNASVSWKPFAGRETSLMLSANNIFDVEARRHASFLKDYAPLAGRDIRVTARLEL